jgi:REP element-mobilizing transposase RayT
MTDDEYAAAEEVLTGTAGGPPAENPETPKGWYSRGYLPHFDVPNLIQFVTFRLTDSVPDELLRGWQTQLSYLEPSARRNQIESLVMKYIDKGEGKCYLRNPKIAALVEECLLYRDGERYNLLSWSIMPNHLHAMIEVLPSSNLSRIFHSWKSYAAHEANKILGIEGDFWFREYFDRYIRDSDHYDRVQAYIEFNPVKAKLCAYPGDWRWSSAWKERGR